MAALLHLRLNSSILPSSSSHPSLRRRPCRRPAAPSTRISAKIREIFMPALSSTMTEGKIVSWVKSEGDRLAKGESVVVVESDKADMDVETFYDGYLAAIMVEEGGVAPVGSAIALLAESEDEIPLAKSQASSSSSSSSSSAVPASPPPAEAPASTTSLQTLAPSPPEPSPVAASSSTHPASDGGRIVATPYAKKLAKDLKVDLAGVAGTGPMGRIVAKDVEAAAAAAVASVPSAPSKAVVGSVAAKAPTPLAVELGTVVPFTTMQGAVSKNMVESLSSKGVTMTALLAKATAMALTKHPVVNSSCRDSKSFTYNASINIAVAVAIDGGLITPVLQDADKGAIMAVGASQPTVVATKDGRIGLKSQMQVKFCLVYCMDYLEKNFDWLESKLKPLLEG
ncbi:hypothetical protein B296_00006732 [Ensete ventricosum]|uniref:Dihydrolipoamide acetyltransferase component of pyruvate dehydrogenase complex n=1 Tax=Ensete ventricosum TaxID=4639 RepID=A0A427BAW4_ENSVE|nr:hypothetical protein B296_00006732 [Ensete ventricosum]